VDAHHPSVLQKLMEKKELNDEMRREFDKVLKEFKQRFLAEHRAPSVAPAAAAAR